MGTFQYLLVAVASVMATLGAYFLLKDLIVYKAARGKLFWFALTSLACAAFVFCAFLLSFPFDQETALQLHRARLAAVILAAAFWFKTVYLHFLGASRPADVYLVFSALCLAAVPWPAFLDAPVRHLRVEALGAVFDYRLGTTGPLYTVFAAGVIAFAVFSLVLLVYRRKKVRHLGMALFAFSPFLAGINDFLVAHGLVRNAMLSELTYFVYLLLINVTFLREELRDQRRLRYLNDELERTNKTLARIAGTDRLTGLANRHRLDDKLDELSELLDRGPDHGIPLLAATFIDLDNFKHYNDTYGHKAGDRMLELAAETIRREVRVVDFPARFGGDEFVIISPGTDAAGASVLAARIRTAVLLRGRFHPELAEFLGHAVDVPDEHRFGMSIGIAALVPGAEGDILALADKALYEAKRAGKDRIAWWDLAAGRARILEDAVERA